MFLTPNICYNFPLDKTQNVCNNIEEDDTSQFNIVCMTDGYRGAPRGNANHKTLVFLADRLGRSVVEYWFALFCFLKPDQSS